MKKYQWDHFSGQHEIVDFLNEPENKHIVPVAVNNDENGNWWLIYYEETEVAGSGDKEAFVVRVDVLNERISFLNESKKYSG